MDDLKPILPNVLQENFPGSVPPSERMRSPWLNRSDCFLRCRQGPPASDQQQFPCVHGFTSPKPTPLIPSFGHSSGSWTQIRHLNRDRYFHKPEGNAFTLFDPSEAGNAATFQNAIDRILQYFAENSISGDVSIVLGLTNGAPGTRKVTYYLVNNENQVVFWLEDPTRVILRLCPGHIADCLRK